MARIICRTPSTGRPIRIQYANIPTVFTSVAEAPDFSVPDAAEAFPVRDPLDSTRTIKSGEIFFLTPLAVVNKSESTQWVETQLLAEDGSIISFGRVLIPAGDTAYIPIQGRSLFKRDAIAVSGDRLQLKAESSAVLDVWGAAEEKLSSEHIGVIS